MITGDHKATAHSYCQEIGIYEENSVAITGAELEELSDEEFNAKRGQLLRVCQGRS